MTACCASCVSGLADELSPAGGGCAMPEKWWLNESTLPGVLIPGGPDETFTDGQRDKFGVDAAGNVQDEAKFATAVKKVCVVRASVTTDKLNINTIYNLREDQWLPEPHRRTEEFGKFSRMGSGIFLMGRLACKITGSQQVFSLRGGGISAHEAKASGSFGVKWTV